MSKQRIGMQAANLFASTTAQTTVQTAAQPKQEIQASQQISKLEINEPKEAPKAKSANSNTVKSTVTLLNNQICFLDRLSSDIRAQTMKIIDRGAIIRAVISALETSNLDLSSCASEQEISEIILAQLHK